MEVDLTNVGIGHELSNYDLNILKSGHLYQKIKETSNEYKFNWIIMSVDVFNILELCSTFKHDKVDNIMNEGIYSVGFLGEYECYVDLYSPSNSLIIKYDKQLSRDNKLKIILDDCNIINEISISVKIL